MIVEDAWLAAAIGRPAFRVEGVDLAEPLPDGMHTARVDTARVGDAARLTALGFYVVDTVVTFDRPPGDPPPRLVETRRCAPQDVDAIVDLGARCFRFSRFHLDPLLGEDLGNHVNRLWVENCAAGRRGEGVIVALREGRAVGFLTMLRASGAAVIDLIGVDPGVQRSGAGESMVAAFVDAYPDVARLRVGTQVANIPSNRFYEKLGFRLAQSQYVLHAHVRGGVVLRPGR